MKSISVVTLLWMIAMLAASCKKDGKNNTPEVHAVGTEYGTPYVAKYWKNGVLTNLSDGINDAVASSIFISGDDVYIAGSERPGIRFVAKYWKNGISTNLTDGTKSAGAYCIVVSDGDVYVAGYENSLVTTKSIAMYWKNGIPVTLTNGNNEAAGLSIFVVSGQV